ILRQAWRVLAPGGGIRIGVPSLEVAVQHYVRGDFSFVSWRPPDEPVAKTFVRYITDDGNHPILLDFDYLSRLLAGAGFVSVQRRQGGDSQLVDASRLPVSDAA